MICGAAACPCQFKAKDRSEPVARMNNDMWHREHNARPDLEWFIEPSGSLRLGDNVQWSDANTRRMAREAEEARGKWKQRNDMQGEAP